MRKLMFLFIITKSRTTINIMNKINFLTKSMVIDTNNKIITIEQYIKINIDTITHNINQNLKYKQLMEDKYIKTIYNFVIKNKKLIKTSFTQTDNIKGTTCINHILDFKYNKNETLNNEGIKREANIILHNMTELVIRLLLMITQNKKYKKWKVGDNYYLEISNDFISML